MTGLDTNILVRYLTQDDLVQSPIATNIMEARISEDDPGFVSTVVMAEIVWVLDRAYGFSGDEVAAAIERMLQAENLIIENEQEVFTAMIALKEADGSFADALIGALCAAAGCSRILTFDKLALGLPGFELP